MSQEEQTIKLDQRDVLDAAMTAGHILLENGAEIFRVEETIDRICHHFGVQSENAFVLSNGIFLTSGDEHEKRFARVEHIPVRGAQLHRVAAVNQLSREIEEGKYTLPEIREKLEQIRNAPGASKRALVLMSGLGSGCFCLMFGGMWQDCVAAFVIGCLLYLYLLWLNGRCSKIVENIGGGIIYPYAVWNGYEPYDQRFHHASRAGTRIYERNPGHCGRRLHFRDRPHDRRGACFFVCGGRRRLCAEHLSSSDGRCHAMTDLLQILAAGIGTVAFGALFGVPSKYYPYCGLIGASGWAVYVFLWMRTGFWSEAVVVFLATVLVILMSRFFAVRERCPVTIFLICGILPLVPGAGIYWTCYYLVTGQLGEASTRGFSALKAAVAIVLGIVFVFEIPQRFFKGKAVRKNDKL